LTQAFEDRSESETSKEDIENNRKLRFVYYLMELTKRDREWKGQFNDLVEQFKESEQ
jgi:hypothetical protein